MSFIWYLAKIVISNTLENQSNLGQGLTTIVVRIITIVKIGNLNKSNFTLILATWTWHFSAKWSKWAWSGFFLTVIHIYLYIEPQHVRLHLNFNKWHNNVLFYFMYILIFLWSLLLISVLSFFWIIIIITISVTITIIFLVLYSLLFLFFFLHILLR